MVLRGSFAAVSVSVIVILYGLLYHACRTEWNQYEPTDTVVSELYGFIDSNMCLLVLRCYEGGYRMRHGFERHTGSEQQGL